MSAPSRVNASTVPWRVIQGVNLPPEQVGSREGFKRDAFLTNSKSGMEALKCDLPLNNRWQEGIPLNKVCLRVVSPSMRPFAQSTFSQMGGRSESPSTPHVNQRWSSESAATLPEGALGEGGV